MMKRRLKVTEHHNSMNPSEVVRVDIDAGETYSVVVEHLSSTKSIIVEFLYPDGDRQRHEHFYYGSFDDE